MAKRTNSEKCADGGVDLLLIGKTGNGKSATGNSMLMRQAFKSSASMDSVTTGVEFDYTEFNGRVIKVVDVRGVQDTRETTAMSTALFIREMEYAIVANPQGYHAFLLVFKYGNRFTQEEVNTVEFLKAVFGETFVKDRCIIIMTGGDVFSFDHGSKELAFQNWCGQEQGFFKELLQECSHRIVLFNNKCKDELEKKKQVADLLGLVDQLDGTRYTDDNFQQAKLAQTELILKSELEDIRENVMKETSLILQRLKLCQDSLLNEIQDLEQLLVRIEALESNLLGVDKKTNILLELIKNVRDIKATISLEIKVHVNMGEWRKTFADSVKTLEIKIADKKYKLNKEFSLLKAKHYENRDKGKKLQEDFDKKLKELDINLENYKCDLESEFANETKRRRDHLKCERERNEETFEKIKDNFMSSLSGSLLKILKFPLEPILSQFQNLLKREKPVTLSKRHFHF